MIKIRLEKNRLGEPEFKIRLDENIIKKNRILYRGVLEGKKISGIYNYKLPMKYFLPIYNNLNKEKIVLDTRSILSYLEFSDEIEENYYYSIVATPNYMKKWRNLNCQTIYKITIDNNTKELKKEVAFKKLKVNL